MTSLSNSCPTCGQPLVVPWCECIAADLAELANAPVCVLGDTYAEDVLAAEDEAVLADARVMRGLLGARRRCTTGGYLAGRWR